MADSSNPLKSDRFDIVTRLILALAIFGMIAYGMTEGKMVAETAVALSLLVFRELFTVAKKVAQNGDTMAHRNEHQKMREEVDE